LIFPPPVRIQLGNSSRRIVEVEREYLCKLLEPERSDRDRETL
jgi:hypothetical protein